MTWRKIVAASVLVLFAGLCDAPAQTLPPEMEADRLLLKAKKKLDNRDYHGAVEIYERILRLRVQPELDFYWHYGSALLEVGRLRQAKIILTTYVRQGGRTARYYRRTLEQLNQIEERAAKQARAEEEARLRRIEEARLRKEEEARIRANTQSECIRGVRRNDMLNMRSGPGPGNAIVGRIPPGACGVGVSRSQCSGKWCIAAYDGVRGWINTKYTSGGPGGLVEHCVTGVASDDTLNMRTGPGSRRRRVAEIDPGACGVMVNLERCRGNWCFASYQGTRGWLHTRYVRQR